MRNRILFMSLFLVATLSMSAQSFLESMLSGVLQGVTKGIEANQLQKIIDTPSLQSQDMQNYLAYYRKGTECAKSGNNYDAAQNYASAFMIGWGTNDQILKKLWNDYGWYKDTKNKVVSYCSLAGIPNPFEVGSSGNAGNYSNGSGSSPSTSTTSRVCNLCHGSGLKIKEYYGAGNRTFCSICQKNVSIGHKHVQCDLCGGTGTLNY